MRTTVPVLAALLLAAPARAETVLGLPRPIDPARPGAVVLHGGSGVTADAFDRFVALAGGRDARIVFVPSAGYRPGEFPTRAAFSEFLARRYSSWVALERAKQIAHFEFMHTDDPREADSDSFLRPLATATGVWFSGGAQERLNERYVGRFPGRTKFQQALSAVVARGGVVGGTSAGMAIMPEVMTLREEKTSKPDAPKRAVAGHGLGMLTGAIVEQHFDGRVGRLERFTGLLRDNKRLDELAGRQGAGARMLGLAVEGGTGLVIRGDALEVVGGGNVHVFIKALDQPAISWHALSAAGGGARLTREAGGGVTLARLGR